MGVSLCARAGLMILADLLGLHFPVSLWQASWWAYDAFHLPVAKVTSIWLRGERDVSC